MSAIPPDRVGPAGGIERFSTLTCPECGSRSRDRMPECPQVVICLAVDRHGWPIAWDLLPGCPYTGTCP